MRRTATGWMLAVALGGALLFASACGGGGAGPDATATATETASPSPAPSETAEPSATPAETPSATSTPGADSTPVSPSPTVPAHDSGLGAYFQQLEALVAEAERRSEEVTDQFDDLLTSLHDESEAAEALRRMFDAWIPIMENFVAGLESLDPPPEVQDPHNRLSEAGEDVAEAFRGIRRRLSDLGPEADVFSLLTALEEDPAFGRFEDACLELQGIADANAIAVDLRCAG